MVRLYEGMFLFDANESARRWSELEGRVGAILQKNGAEVQYAERWPDQRLSFEIQGARKGTYYLTYFNASPDNIQSIRRDAELTEDILRVLIIHEAGLEDEMASRKEVAARRAAAPPPPRAEETEATAAGSGDGVDAPKSEAAESATEETASGEVASGEVATDEAPAEVVATMHAHTEHLVASGQAQRAVGVGCTAPEFSLLGRSGSVSLSGLRSKGPVAMTWFRGTW